MTRVLIMLRARILDARQESDAHTELCSASKPDNVRVPSGIGEFMKELFSRDVLKEIRDIGESLKYTPYTWFE